MNKYLTYFMVALALFLVFSFDNLINGNISGGILTEEIIGFVLLLLGFFIAAKITTRLLNRYDTKFSWTEKPVVRFVLDTISVSVLALLTTVVVILGTWGFFESFGIPKAMDLQVQRQQQNPDMGLLAEERKPPPREARPRRDRKPPLGNRNRNLAEAFKYQPEILLGSMILFMVAFVLEESELFGRRKQKEQLQSMQLAQDQLLVKINALKGQINPHFMFNNLNTLSGLIHEDVDKADRFLKALSKNLRYVLEQNKDVVVTLRKEIEFIKSYIYLQEERFGQKLKVDIDISEEALDYELPALTLELLIENALKHNIVSKSKPMSISVTVDNDLLVVRNTYQSKQEPIESTGIGINNLKEQLNLLGLHGATFGIEKDEYIARIPMLKISKS